MFNRLKKIVIFILLGLMAGPIAAAPILKPSVEVSSLIVTVGDMFDNAGLSAERALFRAPAPGTRGVVSIGAIRMAAAKIGIKNFDDRGLSQVSVYRRGIIFTEQDIANIIDEELKKRGIISEKIIAQINFSHKIDKIYAELSPSPIELSELKYYPRAQSFKAQIKIAGKDELREISGTLNMMINVPHLINSLKKGDIISENDIEMRPVDLRFAQSSDLAIKTQIIGKQLRRSTNKGMALRSSDIMEPELIKRSEMVTLYYRKGPLTLSVKGQALNSAPKGGVVSVLNLSSKNIVQGIALADGAVIVPHENSNKLNIANIKVR